MFTPMFMLNNHLAVPVEVNAYWKGKSRELGDIDFNGMLAFEINDEGKVEFQVLYPDGQLQTSELIYFSQDVQIVLDIYADSVELDYRER